MKILILFIVAVVSFAVFIRYFESRSVFYPSREIPVTPAFLELDFEDVYFKTQDGLTLNGWFVKTTRGRSTSNACHGLKPAGVLPYLPVVMPRASGDPKGRPLTLLYLHGNAGNIGHRLEKIALFHHLGVNVFIIDYRGYGKSQGRPTEQGIYEDALAAYDYLLTRSDVDREKIIGYGDSLGGAVAVDLAAKKKLACLIVDSAFTSVADLTKTIFPFVPSFLLKTKLDSVAKVKKIVIPKLFIHSVNDEIVPFNLGKKLYDAAIPPKEFLQITGGHNTNHIDSRDLLIKGITAFLKKLNLV